MRRWIEPEPVIVPEELRHAVGGHPIVAETLVRRGITDAKTALAFLNPDLYQPASPYDFPNMGRAVERLWQAIHDSEEICVWGDFDVDGQTATTLLVTALQQVGAKVRYYIPLRQREGHGIKVERLKTLLDEGIQLLLTCDTGISEHEAVTFAQQSGVDVIVTDHHKLPHTLPDAFACVNPQMLPETHPLYTLPGVGCAYKLIEALYARLGVSDKLPAFLDLVALGIVADVAVLRGDTRYLLQRGLKILQTGDRLGLKELLAVAEIDQAKIDEEQIGYAIAPRLNAVGRLGDANDAVELLSTDDGERAKILARRFDQLNNDRKLLVQQVFDSAQKQLENTPQLLDYGALVLAHPQWEGGVLGIVANRLVEVYARPVVLLATPQGEAAHGSARSVDGVDITAAIASCSQYLKGYGGHAMAAGLSLPPEAIPDFRRALSIAVESQRGKIPPEPQIRIDGYIELSDLSTDLVHQLARLAPFGAGNPSLTLACRHLKLMSHESVGREKEHLRLCVADSAEHWQNVMWWQADVDAVPNGVFDLAYTVHESVYKGKTELSVRYIDVRQVEEAPPRFIPQKIHMVDYRHEAQPEARFQKIMQQYDDVFLWNAGATDVKPLHETPLREARTLVVWTMPPDQHTWQSMLETIKPQTMILFDGKPVIDDAAKLLTTIMGMLKFAIRNYDGLIAIEQLIWKTGHSKAAVCLAVECCVTEGTVKIAHKDEASFIVEAASGQMGEPLLLKQLHLLVEETKAYWSYFQRTAPEKLLILENKTG
jgi:single-stranded-DNA-specific exonuclease